MEVLIIDSSVAIIERLKQMLFEQTDVETIFVANSINEAFQLFNEMKPAIVLIDSGLQNNESLNIVHYIKASDSLVKVFMLLNFEDEVELNIKYKSVGVDYFFDKYHAFDRIPVAINEIIYTIKTGKNDWN